MRSPQVDSYGYTTVFGADPTTGAPTAVEVPNPPPDASAAAAKAALAKADQTHAATLTVLQRLDDKKYLPAYILGGIALVGGLVYVARSKK